MNFVLDIQEKTVSAPPSAPSLPSATSSGFPAPKKRISAFKAQRRAPQDQPPSIDDKANAKANSANSSSPSASFAPLAERTNRETKQNGNGMKQEDRDAIDRENSARIASMSEGEMEDARRELFSGLDQATLEMLLRRAGANGDDDGHARGGKDIFKVSEDAMARGKDTGTEKEADVTVPVPVSVPEVVVQEPTEDEASTTENTEKTDDANPNKKVSFAPDTHWPTPPNPPLPTDASALEPSHPDFLQALHQKYFPSLPSNPASLAWMAPIPTPNSPADLDSPYHPNQSSIPAASLRFDFRGSFLPPRIARAVPVSKGLHHHGEAPEAAGYTVAELARLSRSAVPTQRCIAYQTLGRILFRLGKGEWGRWDDSLSQGVWEEVVKGRVLASLYEEIGAAEGMEGARRVDGEDSHREGGRGGGGEKVARYTVGGNGIGRGHRSAYAFAIEAIWLYETGGWAEKVRRGK